MLVAGKSSAITLMGKTEPPVLVDACVAWVVDIARRGDLGTSPRRLQRRLAEDGLTFQQLVQEARRELARHYLLHSSLELSETAYLLGYEDAHSFFRGFHE